MAIEVVANGIGVATSSDMVEMFLESVSGIPFAFSHVLEIASCTLYAINNIVTSACDLSFVRCRGNKTDLRTVNHNGLFIHPGRFSFCVS
jgi:hypothetical protein